MAKLVLLDIMLLRLPIEGKFVLEKAHEIDRKRVKTFLFTFINFFLNIQYACEVATGIAKGCEVFF